MTFKISNALGNWTKNSIVQPINSDGLSDFTGRPTYLSCLRTLCLCIQRDWSVCCREAESYGWANQSYGEWQRICSHVTSCTHNSNKAERERPNWTRPQTKWSWIAQKVKPESTVWFEGSGFGGKHESMGWNFRNQAWFWQFLRSYKPQLEASCVFHPHATFWRGYAQFYKWGPG